MNSEKPKKHSLGFRVKHLVMRIFCIYRPTREESLINIRQSMAFFGHDLSDLTDQELEEGIIKMGQIIYNSMPTAQQWVDAMKEVNL